MNTSLKRGLENSAPFLSGQCLHSSYCMILRTVKVIARLLPLLIVTPVGRDRANLAANAQDNGCHSGLPLACRRRDLRLHVKNKVGENKAAEATCRRWRRTE